MHCLHPGTGAVGSYIVLPGDREKTTFREACEKHGVSYNSGTGYYAVAGRKETISSKKLLLLHHIETDTFTIGKNACRKKLGKGLDEKLKISEKDIPDGWVSVFVCVFLSFLYQLFGARGAQV